MIPEEIKKDILEKADLKEVISDFVDLKKKGANWEGKCPMCDKQKLNVNTQKKIYKCFYCNLSGKNSASFLMETQKMNYPEALKYLAQKYNITIERTEPKKKTGNYKSYRDKQLKASGLTDADQKATIIDDEGKQTIINVYEAGTLDDYGKITDGDDIIIWYIGLDGKPITYQKPRTNKYEPLWRIRYQNPDLHLDKNGKPKKYASPYGSGSHLYIPEIVRRAYSDGRQISRLFLQEGEKKTDKACKHGLFSVGIMGIQNIGYNGKLPYELQLLIQRCEIKEVVFVIDSDWNHLSNNLSISMPVDQRPKSFFYAVKNFRDYFKTFKNLGIYLELYFSHIKENTNNDKGIDDLLTNTLPEKEKELVDDFDYSINEKDGEGKFVKTHKITTSTDGQLYEIWNLHSAEAFAEHYKEKLKELPEFIINKHKWRFNKDNKIELSQPLDDTEIFWETIKWEDKGGNERVKYQFDYENAYNFLRNRGYGRIMMASGSYLFCNINSHVVNICEAYQVKDYVVQLAKEIAPKDIRNMLYRGGKMYFGPDSLGNIDFVHPTFEKQEKNFQNLYFKEKFWKITAEKIEEKPYSDMQHYIWSDKIIDAAVEQLPEPLLKIKQINEDMLKDLPTNKKEELEDHIGQFSIEITKEGEKCHFLRFLLNTGEFYWRKMFEEKEDPRTKKTTRIAIPDTRTIDERLETNLHLVSKMTAMGYLLHKYRDKSHEKAVIAMDGKMSEVGDSNGRTGKSILGFAIGKYIPQVYVGGKYKDLTEDRFLWEEVSEKTDNIFVDDVRANLDFEFFFPVITGKLTINAKGDRKFSLPESETPKMLITTNHSIQGNTSSFKDRQAMIAFSDYYNENHKPINDFGINFFDEWDATQWNYFYNLGALCIQTYLKYGIVSPPIERLELRRLRQYMGEDFLTWCDEYFGVSENDDVNNINLSTTKINQRLHRIDLYNDFCEKNPMQKKFTTPHRFKKKIISYCEYRGLRFNPTMVDVDTGIAGQDDKSGGIEFFTLANNKL